MPAITDVQIAWRDYRSPPSKTALDSTPSKRQRMSWQYYTMVADYKFADVINEDGSHVPSSGHLDTKGELSLCEPGGGTPMAEVTRTRENNDMFLMVSRSGLAGNTKIGALELSKVKGAPDGCTTSKSSKFIPTSWCGFSRVTGLYPLNFNREETKRPEKEKAAYLWEKLLYALKNPFGAEGAAAE